MDETESGNLPLAILLLGLGAVALFLMARPWPQTAAGPVKPGAYVVDVLLGKPPPAGPESLSPTEVRLTESGLVAILSLWAAGKAGNALGGIAAGAAGAGGVLGRLWSWVKGIGADVEPEAAAAAGSGADL